MRTLLRWSLALAVVSLGLVVHGCSSSQTSPGFSPEEEKTMRTQELAAEMATLIALEKQYGLAHSQVQQMKVEMGLDPDLPASEQTPK